METTNERPEEGGQVPSDENIGDATRRTSVFRHGEGQQEEPAPAEQPVPPHEAGEGSIAETLRSVAATLEAEPEGTRRRQPEQGSSLLPKPPRNLSEVGLSKAFLTDLTLKIMHYSGTPSAAQLVRRLGLGQHLLQQVLTGLQEDRYCEVMSQSDLFTGNYRYRLSERGTARVMEALERSRYAGPAPITAEQYTETMRLQQGQRQPVSREDIAAAQSEFVLSPDVADAIARALYSGKSAMFYGPSGNGKTSIIERFMRAVNGTSVVPYAIYAYGQVIRVFDPSMHEPVEQMDEQNSMKDDGQLDRRWVLVRRPTVTVGSELGPESLDLAYDPQSRFYQAPPHIKAQGGILLVDDLGRQRIEPRELLTRWMIAAERGWDTLGLITGEKMTVPFDVQLLFSTNLPINELADEALLRRILYKVEVRKPGREEFAEILQRLCRQRRVQVPDGAIERVVEKLYNGSGRETPTAAYARTLLDVVIEGAAYDGNEPVLDDEAVERALRLSTAHNGSSAA